MLQYKTSFFYYDPLLKNGSRAPLRCPSLLRMAVTASARVESQLIQRHYYRLMCLVWLLWSTNSSNYRRKKGMQGRWVVHGKFCLSMRQTPSIG